MVHQHYQSLKTVNLGDLLGDGEVLVLGEVVILPAEGKTLNRLCRCKTIQKVDDLGVGGIRAGEVHGQVLDFGPGQDSDQPLVPSHKGAMGKIG